LFDSGILYFPRTISTRSLNFKQVEVFSKNEALFYFKQSNYIDCRISAFRSSNSKEKFYPDLIIIDIDRSDFKTEKGFKLALSTTLRNIREKLDGHPEIIWSGNGVHVYQPIEAIIFDEYEIFTEFINDFDLFKEFLRYSKNVLSNNKSDPRFKPSQDSSLLRIPGSLNGKFLDNRDKRLSGNFKVKVLQEWNGKRAVIPDDFLEDFRIYLIDRKIKEIKEINNYNNCNRNRAVNNNNYIPYYEYIERLLQTPIHDFRKLVLWRILCPYLINIKNLSYDESYAIIRTWLDKCNTKSGEPLDFNVDQTIRYELRHVKSYFPLGLKRIKTEEEFSELYQILKNKGAIT
jgi:hypothetical protein